MGGQTIDGASDLTCCTLAVQNSSIGDLVPNTNNQSLHNITEQSDPRDL